jgi:hypothetical protein
VTGNREEATVKHGGRQAARNALPGQEHYPCAPRWGPNRSAVPSSLRRGLTFIVTSAASGSAICNTLFTRSILPNEPR